jgi:hypothetical protein
VSWVRCVCLEIINLLMIIGMRCAGFLYSVGGYNAAERLYCTIFAVSYIWTIPTATCLLGKHTINNVLDLIIVESMGVDDH